MSLLAAIILALVQGLTEFLPVSSSGHLALVGTLLDLPDGDITFEVIVHLGTLAAVIAVYWKDLVKMAGGVLRGRREDISMVFLLILGSIPAAIAGFLLSEPLEKIFDMPLVVSMMLLVTGTVLFLTRYAPHGKREWPAPMGAFLIGVAQACALLPGISRSGFTITAGLFSGIRRERAARFSFLLSIPAILGASVLKLNDGIGASSIGAAAAVAGLLVSAVTGYAALRLLLRFLKAGKFSSFAWYCWVVGGAGVVLTLVRS